MKLDVIFLIFDRQCWREIEVPIQRLGLHRTGNGNILPDVRIKIASDNKTAQISHPQLIVAYFLPAPFWQMSR